MSSKAIMRRSGAAVKQRAASRPNHRWAALARALISGSCASLSSTAALTLCGWLERRRPAAPNNGPSQWVWGEAAAYEERLTVRETVVGYGVHHASSIFWALLHEKTFGARTVPASLGTVVAQASATTALALLVDYGLTPRRLRPGFDKHLSKTSIGFVYAAFALGLAAAQMRRQARLRSSQSPR